MPQTKTSTKPTSRARKGVNVWTDEERSAMQVSARERKASAGRTPEEARAEGERDLRESIAKMPTDDRAMAERIHDIVSAAVPSLVPKTYYGMPAYATEGKNGKVIAFFKPKSKFKVRYSTFGFQPDATLDDGAMWPTEFAVTDLTPAVETRIADLVKKAAG
jgi:uncharacterized protein YdhG (YjbR/CyaY superfamily)